MDTLNRSVARNTSATKLEIVGYVMVAVGYVVMALGIVEIGGLRNVVLGLAAAWAGCVVMFLGEERREFDEGGVPRAARGAVSAEVLGLSPGARGTSVPRPAPPRRAAGPGLPAAAGAPRGGLGRRSDPRRDERRAPGSSPSPRRPSCRRSVARLLPHLLELHRGGVGRVQLEDVVDPRAHRHQRHVPAARDER